MGYCNKIGFDLGQLESDEVINIADEIANSTYGCSSKFRNNVSMHELIKISYFMFKMYSQGLTNRVGKKIANERKTAMRKHNSQYHRSRKSGNDD